MPQNAHRAPRMWTTARAGPTVDTSDDVQEARVPDYVGGNNDEALSRDLLKTAFLADGAGGVHAATDRVASYAGVPIHHQRVFIGTALAVLLTVLLMLFLLAP
jgi:hypothetical protein